MGSPWWIGLLVLFTSGRHFAYVGETVTFRDRHLEHTRGGGRWRKPPAAWSDLDPVCVLRIPLGKKKDILHAVEWLFVKLCQPVYNEKLNKANPRRITRDSAKRMRRRRDKRRVRLSLWNIRFGHVLILFVVAITVGVM
jgi:hypothetical protein